VFSYVRRDFLTAEESRDEFNNHHRLGNNPPTTTTSLEDEHFDGRYHYTIIEGIVESVRHFILADGRGQFLYNSSNRLVYPVDANNNPLANTISWRGIRISGRRRG
ncbi:MAG: hypothetical protein FWE37_05410, partial [Spirochaetaceae bacterium]|nr:hypothetical protein [Spirochaetaceae bacterium]